MNTVRFTSALYIVVLAMVSSAPGQIFEIVLDGQIFEITDDLYVICSDSTTSFEVSVAGERVDGSFILKYYQTDCTEPTYLGEFSSGEPLVVDSSIISVSVLRNENYQIVNSEEGIVRTFNLEYETDYMDREGAIPDSDEPVLSVTASEWISREYPELIQTRFGLQLLKSSKSFSGSEYTHIFFDQYGNSIISTIPQGIADRQYVIHVVYLAPAENTTAISYLINQTAGEYLDALVFRGDSEIGEFRLTSRVNYVWTETVTCLSTSTSDIQVEIVRTSYEPCQDDLEENNVIVANRSIRMSPVYIGSFEVGLLNSTLADPVYSLIPLQSDSVGVLHISDDGNRGMVTVMATLYSSPVIWIQKLCGAEIPAYKLYGRNFLDDHEWYQRFFPAVGLEIGSSAVENLFLGLNYEFARGGNLFGGIHYGRVSTMDLPEGFIAGQTPISVNEFNLLLKEEWCIGAAFGLTLDIGILTNMIGK